MSRRKSNVVKAFGLHSVPEPSADIVERLQTLLAQAKKGEIIGIAYVVMAPSRAKRTGWVAGGICDNHDLVAGISILQHEFLCSETGIE